MSAHFGNPDREAGKEKKAAGQASDKRCRSFAEESSYLSRRDDSSITIKMGFVPNMKVPGLCYVNKALVWSLLFPFGDC